MDNSGLITPLPQENLQQARYEAAGAAEASGASLREDALNSSASREKLDSGTDFFSAAASTREPSLDLLHVPECRAQSVHSRQAKKRLKSKRRTRIFCQKNDS